MFTSIVLLPSLVVLAFAVTIYNVYFAQGTAMTKDQAIKLCIEMLHSGVYAMPSYNQAHRDWEITLHTEAYNRDVNTFGSLYNLRFADFAFYRFEGNKTQEFPVFYRP